MKRARAARPGVESLEGRALLSGVVGVKALALHAAAVVHPAKVKTDPAAVAAILAALNGGAGSEFVTLIRRQVPNYLSLIGQFTRGQRTAFTTPGVAVKLPSFQPAYTGPKYDHMTATLAGAVVLPGNVLELAAVTRGPFDEASPAEVVFGIDRGAGARLGPVFAARPKITPDALVTVHVGPYGQNATATVTDLATGASVEIPAAKVQIRGAVARVFVDLAALPSTGAKTSAYRFAMWTQTVPGRDIATVGSFVPETAMVPVGVLKPVKTPKR